MSSSDRKASPNQDFSKLVSSKIEEIRPRLLDLTAKNPLISMSFAARTAGQVRVVDELPDRLLFAIASGQKLNFNPLPALDEDSPDELTPHFAEAYSIALRTDEVYLAEIQRLDPDAVDQADQVRRLERALKDRLRERLGMSKRVTRKDESLVQHARNHGIDPSYDLPEAGSVRDDDRFDDDQIQTLLLAAELERKLNGLMSRGKTWQQETGLNLVRAAFGFLEWKDPKRADNRTFTSPLVLQPASVTRKKTAGGPVFSVETSGEEAETNLVLREKLRREFSIELPVFDGGSLEDYYAQISEIKHPALPWRVRRQIVFGIFPAARMAMYEDLDTAASNFSSNEVVQSLLVGSERDSAGAMAEEYDVDAPEIEAEVPHLVKKADASQFSVLVDLAKGKNLAVEGPPGTGKSDTIVNSIAAALAKGKKVLFVAEKSAALEVVRSRLEEVGLGEFVLPLLAGRSTRDEFMNSVRSRISVREAMPRDFHEHRDRYVGVRGRLSRYVDILSSEWEQSGRTVHHVLAQAIATRPSLESLSPTSLAEHELPAQSYKDYEIEGVVDAVVRLEAAEASPDADRPHWQGTECVEGSPFKVEAILAKTKRAADEYRKLAKLLAGLKQYGIDGSISEADLSTLNETFERLAELIPLDLPGDDRRIVCDEEPEELNEFLAGCEQAQAEEIRLKRVLLDPQRADLPQILADMRDLCARGGIKSLREYDRRKQIDDYSALAGSLEKTSERLYSFVRFVPAATAWTIASLNAARALVEQTPQRILQLRSQMLLDGSAVTALKEHVELGKRLAEAKATLSSTITWRANLSSAQTADAAQILRRAGALGFLSSGYRQAKSFYLSLVKDASFDKQKAIATLENLAKLLEEEEAFNQRAARSAVFGARFDGLATNFADFSSLAEFYELVDNRFPGFESRELRTFLKSAEADLLASIPDVHGVDENFRIDRINILHDRATSELERVRKADQSLSALPAIFAQVAGVEVAGLTALASEVDKFQAFIGELDEDDAGRRLGSRFSGWRTDVADTDPYVQAATVVSYMEFGDASLRAAVAAGNLRQYCDAVAEASAQMEKAILALATAGGEAEAQLDEDLADHSAGEKASYLDDASADRVALEARILISKVRSEIEPTSLLPTIDLLHEQLGKKEGAGGVLDAMLRRSAAQRIYRQFGRELSSYSGANLDSLRADLKKLDDDVRRLSRKALRSQLISGAKPPYGVGRGRVAEYTQMGLLDHLVERKKITVAVRDITRRAGEALLELKPCWMMSPLAVAQYIPKGSVEFDVCIIDEASQMPPEDAIGALYRSKQAMVVGDTKQLPPTNFFHKVYSDEATEEEESDPVTEESVLEMANGAFRPRRMLRWHYRSRHAGLIRFSNRIMYDDDLVVFPSADEDHPNMGVSLVDAKGLYKAGVNTTEAHAVVEAALEFMRNDTERSLGIVAMNKSQADYINERMQYEIARNKAASDYVERWVEERNGLEEFFVKNLENVQGDERDVIFISTVYGPPGQGEKVRQNFGPINGAAGQRRLNVLFTRAKEQIRTFTSMSASDITAEEGTNRGAWMLKRWLEYSAGGPLVADTGTHGAFDSPLEQYVSDQIQSMGCTPISQVGVDGYFIDIGVRHPEWPNGFILGVECDGATYHSSKSARDRDRHRQEVLENLGWQIHRIWSTDWFENPRREAERLREAIAARLKELKDRAARTSVRPPVSPVSEIKITPAQGSAPRGSKPQAPDDSQIVLPLAHDTVGQPPASRSGPIVPTVGLGSTVRIRYLDRQKETFQFRIVKEPSAPERGIVNHKAPLAMSVMDSEEGDEVEVLLGSYIRKAVVEAITK